MEKTHKKNIFKIVLNILLFIYIVIYFLNISGYYENKKHSEVALTNEQIKQFESDVKEGKEIDINNYIQKEEISYANSLTNISDKIGSLATEIFSNGFNNMSDIFKALFG